MIVSGHLSVEMATPDILDAYMPDGVVRVVSPWQDLSGEDMSYGKRDTHHPIGQWTIATSTEHPAVIYDGGASSCSTVIALDRAGNALHFHEAFGTLDRTPDYYAALPERVALDGAVAAITGTNKSLTPKGEAAEYNYIDKIVDDVERGMRESHPDIEFLPLLSKRYTNQRRTHNLVPANTTPCGFAFIPRYLASDSTNHLLVIPYVASDRTAETFQAVIASRS